MELTFHMGVLANQKLKIILSCPYTFVQIHKTLGVNLDVNHELGVGMVCQLWCHCHKCTSLVGGC